MSMDHKDIAVLEADFDSPYCRVDLDIEYAHRDGVRLCLHVIRPVVNDESTKFPLIVFSQGSSWMKQDMGKEIVQLSSFAKRGYVIALAEYRSAEVRGFPSQVLDTRSAVRFLYNNAERYNIDKDNIILWGTSSGAHTVLMCAVTQNLPEFSYEDIKNETLSFRAVIDYYGPTDITKLVPEEDGYKYVGQESPIPYLIGNVNLWHSPEITDKMIPMNYIDKYQIKTPMFILHGTNDSMVHHSQSIDLYECLVKNEVPAEIYLVDNAAHGGGCFWTEAVFDRVEKFISKHIVIDK